MSSPHSVLATRRSTSSRGHLRFVGVPLSTWTYALRVWIAMMAALYAAFWLQLESASSAAVCVGILALPTRGQAYQKAFYRLSGTLIGAIASIVIVSLFSGSRDLFIATFAAWMAVCVFAASLLDGNRAYGAVLCGYTVALVAVSNIDAPQNVFMAAVNRGAAITVGIVSLMIFNDLLGAPDVLPTLISRMEALHLRVEAFARQVLRRGDADPTEVVGLLKAITALRADITTLPSESMGGRGRAAAARIASAAMIREISAAQATGAILASLGDRAEAEAVDAALDDHDATLEPMDRQVEALDASGVATSGILARSTALLLIEQHRLGSDALDEMRNGRGASRGPRLPLFRPREAALRNAVRIFLAIGFGAFLFIVTGWPAASYALTLIGVTAALSVLSTSPRQFARAAIIAMPVAAMLAGVTKFLILDGVDSFPLLALGMAPGVIGASLMLGSGRPKLVATGFLIMVYFPTILAPSNPQSYDPQAYIINSTLSILAVIILFIVLATVLPSNDVLKRRWILRSVHADFRRALSTSTPRFSAEGAAFRDADRVGQLDNLQSDDVEEHKADLSVCLHYSMLTAAAWRVRAALTQAHLPPGAEAEGHAALVICDPDALRRSADRLLDGLGSTAPQEGAARLSAAAALAWMAQIISLAPQMFALRKERSP